MSGRSALPWAVPTAVWIVHDFGSCVINKPCVEHDFAHARLRHAALGSADGGMRGHSHLDLVSGNAWRQTRLADLCIGAAMWSRRTLARARHAALGSAAEFKEADADDRGPGVLMQGSSTLPWAVPGNSERWIEMEGV